MIVSRIAFLGSLLLFSVHASASVDGGHAPAVVSPSSDFCIPGEELWARVVSAESGDVRDMKRLYWHYLGCVSNRELAFHWGRSAADQCDRDMQDEIEQWLRRFRDKSIDMTIPAMQATWARVCDAKNEDGGS